MVGSVDLSNPRLGLSTVAAAARRPGIMPFALASTQGATFCRMPGRRKLRSNRKDIPRMRCCLGSRLSTRFSRPLTAPVLLAAAAHSRNDHHKETP